MCEPTGFSVGSERRKTKRSYLRSEGGKARAFSKTQQTPPLKKMPSPRCRACFCEASHGEEIKRRLALNVPRLECLPLLKTESPLTPTANSQFKLLPFKACGGGEMAVHDTGKGENRDV